MSPQEIATGMTEAQKKLILTAPKLFGFDTVVSLPMCGLASRYPIASELWWLTDLGKAVRNYIRKVPQ